MPEAVTYKVNEARGRLEGLEDRPVSENVEVYDGVHRALQDALATLIAGALAEESGTAAADRVGLSGVLFGATVLAAATSLPELSTGLTAARQGDYKLAFGDIFGGNAFLPVLFLLAVLVRRHAVLPTSRTRVAAVIRRQNRQCLTRILHHFDHRHGGVMNAIFGQRQPRSRPHRAYQRCTQHYPTQKWHPRGMPANSGSFSTDHLSSRNKDARTTNGA